MPLEIVSPRLLELSTTLLGWGLTYWLHSTFTVVVVALVTRRMRHRALHVRDALWKAALLGPLVTASWQVALDHHPLAGRLTLDAPKRAVAAIALNLEQRKVGLGDPTEHRHEPLEGRRHRTRTPVPPRAPSIRLASTQPPVTPTVADASAPMLPSPPSGERWSRRAALAQRTAAVVAQHAVSSAQAALVATQQAIANQPDLLDVAWRTTKHHWPALVVAAWLAGAALGLVGLCRRAMQLRRALRGRRRLDHPALQDVLARLGRTAGCPRRIQLWQCPTLCTPIAWGRHNICVPERFATEFTPAEQELVLAHEVAHLARRDPGWQLTAAILAAIFWFQPLTRLISRQLREVSELLADAWAVYKLGGGLTLAKCLATIASWMCEQRPHSWAPGAAGSPLCARVERLVRNHPRPWSNVWVGLAPAILLIAGVAAIAPRVGGAPLAHRAAHRDQALVIGPDQGDAITVVRPEPSWAGSFD